MVWNGAFATYSEVIAQHLCYLTIFQGLVVLFAHLHQYARIADTVPAFVCLYSVYRVLVCINDTLT